MPSERRLRTLVLAAALVLGSTANAEPTLHPRYDLVRDLAVTGGASAATLSLLVLEEKLAPTRCRWCDPSGVEADLSRRLRWSDPDAAAKGSRVLSFTLAGAALGYSLLDGYRREDPGDGWANALLIVEATSVAMLLDTTAKYAFARQRPDAWRGETRGDRRDRNLSFFSAQSTFAFAIAASSSTLLLEQRAPHARSYAFVVFGAAATTAYLRVAADRHYVSDVLVGAAVGTLVGWAIPHFFHGPTESGLHLAPAPGGIALVW
jgi:membrane-associated phospholipid phosphatase